MSEKMTFVGGFLVGFSRVFYSKCKTKRLIECCLDILFCRVCHGVFGAFEARCF